MFGILDFINAAFDVAVWLIIIRTLISYFPYNPKNPLYRTLRDLTDPILIPIQRYVPSVGGLDFSPLLAILLLYGLKSLVFRILLSVNVF